MNDNHFKFSTSVVLVPFLAVLLLWLLFWIEVRFHFDFSAFGIYPRTISGLLGVLFSPFIHGNLEHLYNNSIPLFILIAALFYFYQQHAIKILGLGILFSGLLTWIIARNAFHIGASGLIYVLVSFIFFKGIFTKYYRLVALSLLVVLLYGSMVWYVFPNPLIEKNISWEGHLAGLLTGFVFAIRFEVPAYKKLAKYDWEMPDYNPTNDKFMQRFDAQGNFVNPSLEETPEEAVAVPYFVSNIPVVYNIVSDK
jgi:membrane associated rhomboid family serine protease